MENSPAISFMKDEDGRYIYVNGLIAQLSAKKPEELVGMTDAELLPPEVARHLHDLDLLVLAEKKAIETMATIPDRDGNPRDFLIYKFPIPNHQRKRILGGVAVDVTERKAAEEALQKAAQEFRLVVTNIPAVLFKGYVDGTVDFFDDRVEALTGYALEEFETRRRLWLDLILPEDLPVAKEAFVRALKNSGIFVREYRLITKAGEVIWIQERSSILRQADGKVDYISGLFFDITARKRGEAALRESEERYRSIFELSSDMVGMIDPQLNFLLVNHAALAMFRMSDYQELLGRNFLDLVAPEYQPVAREDIQRLLNTGVLKDAEWLFIRDDGARFWGEANATLIRDPEGRPWALSGSIRDITDRKEALARAEAERRRFLAMLDGLPAAVFLRNPDYSIRFANRYYRDHVGEPRGRPCYAVAHGRQATCVPCMPDLVFETGQPQTWEWATPTGRHFQVNAYPFADIDGSPLILEFGLDITARKQAELALEDSIMKLRRSLQGTVEALGATVANRDPYTAGHQRRVAVIATAIAQEIGLTEFQIEGLRVISLMHDIGKIMVPAEILSKPGKITDLEFSLIKQHPQVGYEILQSIEFAWPVATAILQHHERLNGSGYPKGLSGQEIILEARILAVADVVEAMASHRPYRAALGTDEALKEITKNKSILYDPEIVDACVKLLTTEGFKFD